MKKILDEHNKIIKELEINQKKKEEQLEKYQEEFLAKKNIEKNLETEVIFIYFFLFSKDYPILSSLTFYFEFGYLLISNNYRS